jgi:hypothetical protein
VGGTETCCWSIGACLDVVGLLKPWLLNIEDGGSILTKNVDISNNKCLR